jgi:hypothetical protein
MHIIVNILLFLDRQELNVLNNKIKEVCERKIEVHKGIGEAELTYAHVASELALVNIKEKVVSNSLEKLQRDLVKEWDTLVWIKVYLTFV